MRITTQNDGVTAVIRPRGEIDFETLPELLTATRRLPPNLSQLIWNLQEAPFMDAAGLHLLIHQRLECLVMGRKLTVTGLQQQPVRMLNLARELFPAGDWDDFLKGDMPTLPPEHPGVRRPTPPPPVPERSSPRPFRVPDALQDSAEEA
ncbi:STAS domain-containing protein [Streptomyces bauhiniae]|uniref:STAS domain-containing protein n=1 Tax=Streptomyces bauhiniae TaxID=2340725 RepID=UPI00365E62FB